MSLDSGIIDKLVNILLHDDVDVKKEAVWALSNSTQNAQPHQILEMVKRGILKALSEILKLNDNKSLIVAMEGIENVLKVGQEHFMNNAENVNEFVLELEKVGGVDRIEALQQHKNHAVYDRAVHILEKYFNEEEDNVDAIMDMITNKDNGASYTF